MAKKKEKMDLNQLRNAPRIQQYFHCRNCFTSEDEERVKESGLLAVGWTKEGVQIFCEGCSTNVYDIDFQGQKVKLL